MNMTPRAGLSHPLVIAYLQDLDLALSSADPQERIDTITAVSEHLADALGGDPAATTEQVKAVLDELGSVEQIAASATPAAQQPANKSRETGWVAPTLLATSILSLVLPIFGALLAIGCLVTAVVLLRGGAPRRPLLRATVGVSIVTLLITAALVAGSLALSTFSTTEGGTVSDVTGSSSAVPAPSVVVTIPSQP